MGIFRGSGRRRAQDHTVCEARLARLEEERARVQDIAEGCGDTLRIAEQHILQLEAANERLVEEKAEFERQLEVQRLAYSAAEETIEFPKVPEATVRPVPLWARNKEEGN